MESGGKQSEVKTKVLNMAKTLKTTVFREYAWGNNKSATFEDLKGFLNNFLELSGENKTEIDGFLQDFEKNESLYRGFFEGERLGIEIFAKTTFFNNYYNNYKKLSPKRTINNLALVSDNSLQNRVCSNELLCPPDNQLSQPKAEEISLKIDAKIPVLNVARIAFNQNNPAPELEMLRLLFTNKSNVFSAPQNSRDWYIALNKFSKVDQNIQSQIEFYLTENTTRDFIQKNEGRNKSTTSQQQLDLFNLSKELLYKLPRYLKTAGDKSDDSVLLQGAVNQNNPAPDLEMLNWVFTNKSNVFSAPKDEREWDIALNKFLKLDLDMHLQIENYFAENTIHDFIQKNEGTKKNEGTTYQQTGLFNLSKKLLDKLPMYLKKTVG